MHNEGEVPHIILPSILNAWLSRGVLSKPQMSQGLQWLQPNPTPIFDLFNSQMKKHHKASAGSLCVCVRETESWGKNCCHQCHISPPRQPPQPSTLRKKQEVILKWITDTYVQKQQAALGNDK